MQFFPLGYFQSPIIESEKILGFYSPKGVTAVKKILIIAWGYGWRY